MRSPQNRYSAASLIANTFTGHRRWPSALPSHDPKPSYDVIVIGAGGHGLATAYYLAAEHGITDVGVLDRGWLGGGNVTRNTAIVRSNYFLPSRGAIAAHSLEMWERLSLELNFNIMFAQRGILNLAHSEAQLDDYLRRGNAVSIRGGDIELVTPAEIARMVPTLDLGPGARHPIVGGLFQPTAGTIRHDAVAWGYARAAAALGVDVIEQCEVTGIVQNGGRVTGVETSRGPISAGSVVIAVSAGSSHLASMAGLRLPIENHLLQAAVTEPLAPFLGPIVTHGIYNFYVSQTDKGEVLIGGNIDGYNTHTSRGDAPPMREAARAMLSLFPSLGRVRLMRTWGGVVDMSMDGSPIVSELPVDGLYLNTGWCYGGFKTTPSVGWHLAEMVATRRTPPMLEPFSLDRFATGHLVQEEAHGPRPWRYH